MFWAILKLKMEGSEGDNWTVKVEGGSFVQWKKYVFSD